MGPSNISAPMPTKGSSYLGSPFSACILHLSASLIRHHRSTGSPTNFLRLRLGENVVSSSYYSCSISTSAASASPFPSSASLRMSRAAL